MEKGRNSISSTCTEASFVKKTKKKPSLLGNMKEGDPRLAKRPLLWLFYIKSSICGLKGGGYGFAVNHSFVF